MVIKFPNELVYMTDISTGMDCTSDERNRHLSQYVNFVCALRRCRSFIRIFCFFYEEKTYPDVRCITTITVPWRHCLLTTQCGTSEDFHLLLVFISREDNDVKRSWMSPGWKTRGLWIVWIVDCQFSVWPWTVVGTKRQLKFGQT